MNDLGRKEIDLWKLLKYLIKKLPVFLFAALIAAGAAFLLFKKPASTTYTMKVSFFVQPSYVYTEPKTGSAENDIASDNAVTTSVSSLETYTYVASSPAMLEAVINRAGLPYSVSDLGKMVSVEARNVKAYAFSVTIKSRSKDDCARIAEAYADYLPEELSEMTSCVLPLVLDRGTLSARHSSGASVQGMLLAAFAAIFVLLCLYTKRYADDEAKGNIALLKEELPALIKEEKPVTLFHTAENEEDLKRLRATLRLAASGKSSCPVIGLTGAKADSEKETIAFRLAGSFAELGDRVLLIDANLHDPCLHISAGSEKSPGLCDALRKKAAVSDLVKKIVIDDCSFSFLPAGDDAGEASELLDERRLLPILQELQQENDLILLNLEPVGERVDTAPICRAIDGSVVFVRERKCTRYEFKRCIGELSFAAANIFCYAVLLPSKPFREKT